MTVSSKIQNVFLIERLSIEDMTLHCHFDNK
jgi:hypothetical protein